MTTTWRLAVAGAATAGFLVAGAPAWAQLDQTVSESERATADAAASQARIDRLADETGDLFREYRATLNRIEAQRLLVEQREVFLESQQTEITDLERQITEVADVLRDLLPLQFEMIDELDAFIRADIPFQRQDRLDRISRLRGYMDDPNIAPAERYRQIIDAYQIEADYGRFLDAWQAPLNLEPLSNAPADPNAPTVDYLLIGRVAWVYMTQDDTQAGIWNAATNSWDDLPGSFRADIRNAIRMASGTRAPNVFLAPVPGATRVEGPQG